MSEIYLLDLRDNRSCYEMRDNIYMYIYNNNFIEEILLKNSCIHIWKEHILSHVCILAIFDITNI